MPSAQTELAALLDPRHTLQASLAGSPGRMRTHARWDTGVRVLDEHLVYLLTRGSARLESQRDAWILGRDAVVVVPPGIPFRIRSHLSPPIILRVRLAVRDGASGSIWRCAQQLLVRQDGRGVRPWLEALIADVAEVADLSEHRVSATSAAVERERTARIRALALLVLSEVTRQSCSSRRQGHFDERQRRTLEDLLESPRARSLTPRDLAAHLGLSLDYCTRCFRRSFGVSPREHLVRHRIRSSCAQLLQEALPLARVAQSLGYHDVNLYARQFRRVMGISPGAFRARRAAQVPL